VPRRMQPALRALLLPDSTAAGLTASERLALDVRATAARTGRCTCGATMSLPEDFEPGGVYVVRVEHERDCPAISPAAQRALRKLGLR